MAVGPATSPVSLKIANLGFPRMDRQRELKFALEAFWAGRQTEADLLSTAGRLRVAHWKLQQGLGVDYIPSNDFSLYDQVLDTLVLLGATPARFGHGPVTLERLWRSTRPCRYARTRRGRGRRGRFLEGFAFTENGWVQSYGSRCVKPPILYGDVARPRPMTVEWASFAQSLSTRPMKGMLTGPITILQWSFVRNDIPRHETSWQIALALRQEVADLEAAGIHIIQVDEPALREGLPLRVADWEDYLDWAVKASVSPRAAPSAPPRFIPTCATASSRPSCPPSPHSSSPSSSSRPSKLASWTSPPPPPSSSSTSARSTPS